MFPFVLQTLIIAKIVSVGGEGAVDMDVSTKFFLLYVFVFAVV